MRISPICSSSYQKPNCRKNTEPAQIKKLSLKSTSDVPNEPIAFKGKGGMYTGMFLGGGAIVALAFTFMAPAIAATGALVATLSGMAGDKIEDDIKDKLNKKK